MIIIIESIAIQIAAVFILWIFLQWLCKKHPRWRNATSFILSLGSSYSASFVFDMLMQVGIGRLPFANVILPAFTWTGLAIVCHILSLNAALSIHTLYIPYLINALIALLATILNLYNIFVVLFLLLIAIIIYKLERKYFLQDITMFELCGYHLDQDIRNLNSKLVDFSHVLGFGNFARWFSDEKIFKTKEIDFLSETWECLLGVTDNKIYKIALSVPNISNIFEKATKYFSALYGESKEKQTNAGLISYIWDLTSGNLVISHHQPSNVINIIATSGTPFNKTNPNLIVPK